MGRNFKSISPGIRLVPHDSTTLGAVGGDMEVLSSNGKAYFYNASQSSTSPLVTESHSAVLINKEMDGDDNTFTNIPSSALSGDISRNKIAASTANEIVVNDGSGLLSSTPVLNVARGGTGASTLTGYVKGAGTSALTASATIPRADVAAGTAGHVVINSGGGALSSEAQLSQSRGGTAIGSYTAGDVLFANASAVLTKLPIGSEGTALKVTSGLPVWGSIAGTLSTRSTTANYTLVPSDDVVFANATGAIFTLTLPSAASNTGKYYRIRKTDATFNAVTVSDGGGFSTTLNTQGESIDIVSDGTDWQLYDRVVPSVAGTYVIAITGSTSNPTKGTVSTDIAYWYRQRNTLVLQYTYVQTNNSGAAAGSGTYLFNVPTGLTIDTAKLGPANTSAATILGTASALNITTSFYGAPHLFNSTKVYLRLFNETTAVFDLSSSSSIPLNSGAAYRLSFTATIPISGWNV